METGKKLIVLSGGGSGGPVTPLLALVPDLQRAGYEIAWVGTFDGIEKKMVAEKNIAYHAISAGKLRRYFSFQNIFDAFRILAGFFQSLSYLSKARPALVITAGAFVSVPLVWAAWALRIKIIVHQQDLRPGLANRLMAPLADAVTVTFEKSLNDFGKKAVWTGNPVRQEFRELAESSEYAADHASESKRILVLGGGTGSEAINDLVKQSLAELTEFCDVVHVTAGKLGGEGQTSNPKYFPHSFLNGRELAVEMNRADLVITRAGLGTLSELSYLGKPTIIIPMPNSHQEDNARYFAEKKAVVVLEQKDLDAHLLTESIQKLLNNSTELKDISIGISSAMKKSATTEILGLIRLNLQ